MENIICIVYDFDIDKYYNGIILNNKIYLVDEKDNLINVKNINYGLIYNEMQAFFIDEDNFDKVGEDKSKYKWGYFYCKNGKIAILPIYDEAFPFEGGLACIKLEDKYGFINYLGNEVIEPIYDYTDMYFRGGICLAKKDGKFGHIDIDGNTKIKFKYDFATEFLVSDIANGKERFYAIVKEEEKYGIINIDGTYLIEPIYEELRQTFFEDLLIARLEGKYAILKVIYSKELGRQIVKYISEHIFEDFGSMIEINQLKGENYFYSMKVENSVCVINRNLELYFGEAGKQYVNYKGVRIVVDNSAFSDENNFRYRIFKGE